MATDEVRPEPSKTPVSARMIEDVAKAESALLERIRELAGANLELINARYAQMGNRITPEEFQQVASKYRSFDQTVVSDIHALVEQHIATIKQLASER